MVTEVVCICRVHDKAYKRWMPHINMIYPFKADINDGQVFTDAAHTIQERLADIPPFKVAFSKQAFNNFSHRKNCTLWLKPLQVDEDAVVDTTEGAAAAAAETLPSHPTVMKIQQRLVEMFPEYTDQSRIRDTGFQPHLSLGQFKPKVIQNVTANFQASWTDIEFEVKEIYIISRANFDDPFHIRHTVPLGTK